MISENQLETTITANELKEFGHFTLSHCNGGELPDYEAMDLMRIPHLVPNIWVYDLRNDENTRKLLINFAGEVFRKQRGLNVMGRSDIELLEQDGLQIVSAHYVACIENRRAGYTRRYESIQTDYYQRRWRSAETLFFPCSCDGETVNWGIGCSVFGTHNKYEENILQQI